MHERRHERASAGGLREPLRVVIVGHVDHGKSTLVGRLLHDTGSLPDGKLEAIKAMCERRGMPFEWAFLMDAFQSERDQGITIDIEPDLASRPSGAIIVIIDAPGHREFLKNMITGAAASDAALLLIDASEASSSSRAGTASCSTARHPAGRGRRQQDGPRRLFEPRTSRNSRRRCAPISQASGITPTPCRPGLGARRRQPRHRHPKRCPGIDGPTPARGARGASSPRRARATCRCGFRCRTSTSSTSGASSRVASRAAGSPSATRSSSRPPTRAPR